MRLGLVHIPLGLALLYLWLRARPALDPVRIRARTASQLSEYEWCRLGMEHGRQAYLRDRDWRRQRRAWLKGLAAHLRRCESGWREKGWHRPVPRLLEFHKRYATETQR